MAPKSAQMGAGGLIVIMIKSSADLLRLRSEGFKKAQIHAGF